MSAIVLSIIAFASTALGGLFSIRYREKIHLIMGFSAGVLLGVVFFDLFPEIIDLMNENGLSTTTAMMSIVAGFLIFHILEKTILIHHSHEDVYVIHSHPHVGMASAIVLAGHSFLDGVGIGLGFQVSHSVGLLVAFAVIAHDFTDGMNTVNFMLAHRNSDTRAKWFLFLVSIAPILGAISTLFFHLPNYFLLIYLGIFAGFLLYIGASDILPEAHSKNSSYKTIGLTLLGLALIYIVSIVT